ncbi:hypothetical protein CONCODRAFT_2541 [Conidiobolus coronatus NRRL 28638]|uniref:G-protein coupled receptors family 1 profile domain-containing protein n=1 Tax=Conidiobolus coronatus (strain ATCC 28846 / CBS 209.66 / NRRL 28638) TaxID=796925 RepID=A0A137PH56_CONC2|nr:hypothetical protein CONCODRAFT_2541 [Conidiobolus coronatus NRRL 28638]|eukprot:KXN74337.1 hypothetical protein CONCODRAFT_2541 [Conidiobolus coronatus NRRL 28638]
MNLPNKINLTIHPIGMTCAILVLVSIIGLTLINRNLANRMTVRLIAAIALADLLTHVGEFYSASNITLPNGTPLCTAVSVFRSFSRTFYCFTNLAICFHLYRTLVLMKKTTWKVEVYTWIVTAVMVVVFTLIYYALGVFSGKARKSACNPGADSKTMNTIYFLFVGILDLITIAVGIFTTVMGHRNLNKTAKKMASRSFLYPLSTCITLIFEALLLILNAFGIMILEISIPKTITVGLSGFLTLLAFTIDPATHIAFKSAFYQVKNGNTNTKDIGNQYGFNSNDIQLNDAK